MNSYWSERQGRGKSRMVVCRFPPEVAEKIERAAKRSGMSIAGVVRYCVTRELRRQRAKKTNEAV